jgi:hypothetical protein
MKGAYSGDAYPLEKEDFNQWMRDHFDRSGQANSIIMISSLLIII